MNIEDFLIEIKPQYHGFVLSLNNYLTDKGCKIKITTAKNGYLVSYQYGKKKYVLMNFVFRKGELVARIYGNNAVNYIDILESLPESMKKSIHKAGNCKRFEDPPKCTPKCGGYVFKLEGSELQKCRYFCFMFEVNEETAPYIRTLIEKELECRESSTC